MNRKLCATLLLDTYSNHYQVEMRPDEAMEFTAALDDYNGFDPDRAVKLIERINDLIPPMQFGSGNPNNDKPHHTFRVGREYSRVMYLDVVKAYMPINHDYAKLAGKLGRLGNDVNADEAGVVEDTDGCFTFRFWWD